MNFGDGSQDKARPSLKARSMSGVYLNGRQSTLPHHPSHEIGEGLRKAILKQLGLG
ncbi:type II toxin-antitoxin system HicA family toxin [Cupriavidus alkaliphilus]|uniref:type II toxin-antitoxin system HicA family toxin n=1 Tax=Cupriavidus alkaliphilus TaxID=942866 RepID=UPI001817FE7E|nr:hypothetical protein [Cupriavidus alkaliphilus]